MKRTMIICLFVLLSLLFSVPAFAAVNTLSRSTEINYNGEFIQVDVPPVLISGRLLVPIRAFTLMGLTYTWDGETKTVAISNKSGNIVQVIIGSNIAYKDLMAIQMDVPAQIRNNRVFVPIRFVAEAFGVNVKYEALRNIVFVQSADYTVDLEVLNQYDDLQAARKVAISLPLTVEFEWLTCDDNNNYESEGYVFPEGRADYYMFLDAIFTSFVEINNGKAEVVAQVDHTNAPGKPYKRTTGNINKDKALGEQPVGVPYRNNTVGFSKDGDKATATYSGGPNDGGGLGHITGNIKVYSDLILKLPANK